MKRGEPCVIVWNKTGEAYEGVFKADLGNEHIDVLLFGHMMCVNEPKQTVMTLGKAQELGLDTYPPSP